MKSRAGWYVVDWAGIDVLRGKNFRTFDDAVVFLHKLVEEVYPETVDNEDEFDEALGEYCVIDSAEFHSIRR